MDKLIAILMVVFFIIIMPDFCCTSCSALYDAATDSDDGFSYQFRSDTDPAYRSTDSDYDNPAFEYMEKVNDAVKY